MPEAIDAAPLACIGRRTPHSTEAEASLLGAVLVKNSTMDRVSGILREEHFALLEHRAVWRAMVAVIGSGHIADPITLRDHLADTYGDPTRQLMALADCAVTPMRATDYALLIRDTAVRRQIIERAERLISCAYDPGDAPTDAIIDAALIDMADMLHDNGMGAAALTAAEIAASEEQDRPLLLGDWLREGHACLIYGGKSVGKTWLASSIACAIAGNDAPYLLGWKSHQPGAAVLYVDGEMGRSDIRRVLRRLGTAPHALTYLTPESGAVEPVDIATRAGQQAIERHITDATRLVVLDNLLTLSSTPSGSKSYLDEIAHWKNIQRWIVKLRTLGKTVLMLHHASKGGSQLGTVARTTIFNSVLRLSQPSADEATPGRTDITIEFEALRGAVRPAPIRAALIDTPDGLQWAWAEASEQRERDIAEMTRIGMTPAQISAELGCSARTVRRAMDAAGISRPAWGGARRGQR